MNQQQWNIKEVLTWSTGYLKEKGSDSARLDAELLMADALNLQRIQLYTLFDKPLAAEERQKIRLALQRRAQGEPVAYILGTKEFMGHKLRINAAVLIPRPDTEVLVEQVLAEVKREQVLEILDVGTGSGCIAIALAAALENASVTGWDVSTEALEVASANAARLEIENVAFAERDALEPWPEDHFDVIASNPPYITASEMQALPDSVSKFEPHQALAGGEDGLDYYRFFAQQAFLALKSGGRLYLEIGCSQAAVVEGLLKEAGLREIAVVQDYAGLDRVVKAVKA